MADVVSNVNQKIFSGAGNALSSINWMTVIGWIFLVIILIAGGYYLYVYYRDKRIFNIRITLMKNINGYYKPRYRDNAKVVKLGKGSFEIIYLQKAKTWKIAYGGDDDNDMFFYEQPDKYWIHGQMSSNVQHINAMGGLIPVVTTNPLMRSQYTSLEKMIDSLHQDKKTFWEQYGSWVLGAGFVLIAGFMLWLNYKEYAQAMGQMAGITEKLGALVDRVNNMLALSQTAGSTVGGNGLIPV